MAIHLSISSGVIGGLFDGILVLIFMSLWVYELKGDKVKAIRL
jgi:hypothetical protein